MTGGNCCRAPLAEVVGIWKPLTSTTPPVPSSPEGGGVALKKTEPVMNSAPQKQLKVRSLVSLT